MNLGRIWVSPEAVAHAAALNEDESASAVTLAKKLVGLRDALPCIVCDGHGCEFCPAASQ